MQSAAAYLDSLNPEQRRAVEHGAAGQGPFAPLLVIAGAGSGKTNTLAHRVAHLIVNGADPRRILLMTFSRRAASEMTKRVERIARKVMGNKGVGKLAPFGICQEIEVLTAGGKKVAGKDENGKAANGYLRAHLILDRDEILPARRDARRCR